MSCTAKAATSPRFHSGLKRGRGKGIIELTHRIMKTSTIILILIIAAAICLLWWGSSASHPRGPVNPDTLPGIRTSAAPWPPELDHLRGRLDAIGLSALAEEGTALHIHEHLDIFVDGNRLDIPQNIGINNNERFIAPIHTHDGTGIIHVESPTSDTFTLGQFFDIWGVRFTATCVGGYCAGEGKTLSVWSNGKAVAGDPRALELQPHQEIAIVYGPLPASTTIPSSYDFPAGL